MADRWFKRRAWWMVCWPYFLWPSDTVFYGAAMLTESALVQLTEEQRLLIIYGVAVPTWISGLLVGVVIGMLL